MVAKVNEFAPHRKSGPKPKRDDPCWAPMASTKSKYFGVDSGNGRRTWRSTIRVDGSKITLGTYNSEIEAAKAYDEAASDLFYNPRYGKVGTTRKLNFPVKKKSKNSSRMRRVAIGVRKLSDVRKHINPAHANARDSHDFCIWLLSCTTPLSSERSNGYFPASFGRLIYSVSQKTRGGGGGQYKLAPKEVSTSQRRLYMRPSCTIAQRVRPRAAPL